MDDEPDAGDDAAGDRNERLVQPDPSENADQSAQRDEIREACAAEIEKTRAEAEATQKAKVELQAQFDELKAAFQQHLRETENLDALTDMEAEQVLGFRPVLVLAGTDAGATLAAERNRREWTVWVLLGLFLVASGEAAWAWFCGKAW